MSFKEFCVTGIVLMTIASVSPAAPPKPPNMSKEDYVKSILQDRPISSPKVLGSELPIADLNKPKYIISDDVQSIPDMMGDSKFVEKFKETVVPRVEQQTAFRLTVQNYWNQNLECIQRIKIYEELEKLAPWLKAMDRAKLQFDMAQLQNPPTGKKPLFSFPSRKFKETPRDELLARCEGGYSIRKLSSMFRFSYADAIHFYGANRLIYRVQDQEGYFCIERTYTLAGRQDKRHSAKKCQILTDRLHEPMGSERIIMGRLGLEAAKALIK